MLRIGLTGGMGAGKSTVATALAEHGAVVVDSDRIAREVVEPGTPGLAALVEAFGPDILDGDNLDRAALAAKAFADDAARLRLNSILHPLIGQRTAETIAAAPADAIVVQDIPLLVENHLAPLFNLVIVVHADADVRIHRLAQHRGVTEADARARIAAQASDEQRRAVADVWLDNGGAAAALRAHIDELWHERLVPFEQNVRLHNVVEPAPELRQPNPDWAVQAERLIARLRLVCADKALRVDHVGSTVVPGLPAVDMIDLQVTVADLETADGLAPVLAEAGFPKIDDVTEDSTEPSLGGEVDPGVWALRRHGGADPARPVSIDLRVAGWPGQQFALLLADWLRADATARDDYAALKRTASGAHATLPDYRAAKQPWFDTAYRRAWDWARQTGWTSAR
ncbi:dephospho-CoA kinase [Skermania sp. ID1734]|uniref:dephospho-CoA kinase n=1 Tax=Skermania sp. ID1734 TaxID=2597516 RepID=UPI00117F167C|nr:dephospho-CoA kinase [Skermania sp. ID1734]TSD98044.1 dephospho-CoA kinase [Skermania sp. ID1734]